MKVGIVGQKLKRSREQGGMERDVRILGRKHQRQRKRWTGDRSRRQRETDHNCGAEESMHDHDCGDCRRQEEIGAQDILLGSDQNDSERYQNQRQQKGRQRAMRTLVCRCDLPIGLSSSSTRETGRHPFRLLVLSDWRPGPCFGTYFQHLSLEASTTGCLPQRREWMDRKFFFDEKIGVLPHGVFFQKMREENVHERQDSDTGMDVTRQGCI